MLGEGLDIWRFILTVNVEDGDLFVEKYTFSREGIMNLHNYILMLR